MRLLPFLLLPVFALQALGKPPEIVIYNSGFAVVRDVVPLDLQAGENSVRYGKVTEQIDPGSVILRDPTGQTPLLVAGKRIGGKPLPPRESLGDIGATIAEVFHVGPTEIGKSFLSELAWRRVAASGFD